MKLNRLERRWMTNAWHDPGRLYMDKGHAPRPGLAESRWAEVITPPRKSGG